MCLRVTRFFTGEGMQPANVNSICGVITSIFQLPNFCRCAAERRGGTLTCSTSIGGVTIGASAWIRPCASPASIGYSAWVQTNGVRMRVRYWHIANDCFSHVNAIMRRPLGRSGVLHSKSTFPFHTPTSTLASPALEPEQNLVHKSTIWSSPHGWL